MFKQTVMALFLLLPASTLAQDPVRVGWPPCQGGETGMWQVYVRSNIRYLAVVANDNSYEDPANIRCFLDDHQGIQVIATRRG